MFWILLGLLLSILFWIQRRFKIMSILSRNGIPGNKPHLIFGNYFEMKGLTIIEKQNLLIKRFGKIVGYYNGAKPNILVADPELAKNIQIKDFHNFINRTNFMRYLNPTPKADGCLLIARGQKWKQIRCLLTPAFSASKLRNMTPLVNDSINTFLDIINKMSKLDQEFDIHVLYQRLFLEILIKTAFGIEIDAQNNSDDDYVKTVHKYLDTKVNKFLLLLVLCFPGLDKITHFIRGQFELICDYLGVYPSGVLLRMCSQIIYLRKQNSNFKRNDILQAMIDSVISEEVFDIQSEKSFESNEQMFKLFPNCFKPMKTNEIHFHMTEDEIKANCIVLLSAGYDTSSTVLAFATHLIAKHPEVQQKIREEVTSLFESEGKLDYNTVSKLLYMEWVLNETMRLYPPIVNGTTRECMADYQFNGITIPKGANIVMCTHFLQNDPDYWSQPKRFDPMRFSPERRHEINSSSWQPFGGGPRNCIGMRLAYLKMKLTLAILLLNYRLEMGSHSEIGELKTHFKLISMVPKNGVFIKAIKL